MIWFVAAILALWLLLLTLGLAALARSLATITVALRAGGSGLATMDFDADGPEIGASVPLDVASAGSANAAAFDRTLYFFVSPSCGTCLECSEELAKRPELIARTIAFVVGTSDPDARAVSDLRAALSGLPQALVVGEQARKSLQALSISSLPFVVSAAGGIVESKLFVRRVEHFVAYIDSQRASFQQPPKETV